MSQYHFDPASYLAMIREDVPLFDELQERVAAATAGVAAQRILELGTGTGETARRMLARHPHARLTGIDSSAAMLDEARRTLDLSRVDALLVRDIEEPLPDGPFELVVSSLAVHHLRSAKKRELFTGVAAALAPGGRFVLGDLVVPERPEDMVTPATPGFDRPDSVPDLLRWLGDAGLDARLEWAWKDLAVIAAEPRLLRPVTTAPWPGRASPGRRDRSAVAASPP